jgi:hypothetical protein
MFSDSCTHRDIPFQMTRTNSLQVVTLFPCKKDLPQWDTFYNMQLPLDHRQPAFWHMVLPELVKEKHVRAGTGAGRGAGTGAGTGTGTENGTRTRTGAGTGTRLEQELALGLGQKQKLALGLGLGQEQEQKLAIKQELALGQEQELALRLGQEQKPGWTVIVHGLFPTPLDLVAAVIVTESFPLAMP